MKKIKDNLNFEEKSWIDEERKRESSYSAWDFDETKNLSKEHSDNCDSRLNAKKHHLEHLMQNNENFYSNNKEDFIAKQNLKKILSVVPIFVSLFIIIGILFNNIGFIFMSIICSGWIASSFSQKNKPKTEKEAIKLIISIIIIFVIMLNIFS